MLEPSAFDPNAPCHPNGRYFGFPYTSEEADLVLLPVPWDVTVSYQAGAADGPQAILNASYQLDFFDFKVKNAWEKKIATAKDDFAQIRNTSRKMRPVAQKLIEELERSGGNGSGAGNGETANIGVIEASSMALNEWVEEKCDSFLSEGKKIGLIGGDHSVPFGYYKSLSKVNPSWGILHIDAHADLRQAYEGFTYSHASIMYNALSLKSVEKIVQVGVRDLCSDEFDLTQKENRICLFSDVLISEKMAQGTNWAALVDEIISALPQKVYISLDIDGLEPSLCPHTGTPVPGGLSFAQIRYLLYALIKSDKEIIGFDLCEVAPDKANPKDEWDGNVGARILYLLCLTALKD